MSEEIKRVAKAIFGSFGLKAPPELEFPFQEKIISRMSALGISHPMSYLDLVRKDPIESQAIVNELTVHVSRFFRNPLIFELLAAIVLPELIRQKHEAGDNTLKIWSAGCAGGEEPYSIAIMLKEVMPRKSGRLNVQIFATDIDRRLLTLAKKGEFSPEKLDNVKYKWVEKYFTPKNGRLLLNANIRKMVYFSHYDMTDAKTYVPPESVFGNFDLVLCRNLLIYYSAAHQNLIFDKLHRSLANNGCLVLGAAESLPATYKNRFNSKDMYSRIFIKKH
nr:protein-glutamate O-methyltransferase CheR [uncultured Desulfobacter sp.]